MLQHFIIIITIIFGSSIVIIAACKRLNIPPVIGFILTGLAIGPQAAGLVNVEEDVKTISELGIVFLLFMVGLDFTPDKIKRLSRIMFIGGSVQAALTISLALLLPIFGILSFTKALLGSFVIIQSSTAIALKVYHERGESSSPHAEMSIGIALFQDFFTVLLLLLIPLLGTGTQHGLESILLISRNTAIFILCIIAAYFLLPLIIKLVIGTGIRELIVLLTLVLSLGFAELSQYFGFSLALGSFVCGILLSRSQFHTQITTEIAPFKDVFLSMFFISIGIQHNWNFALKHTGVILALTAGVIVLKTVILFISSKAVKFPFRTSLLSGVGLSNIGEFGFVIMIASLPFGLLSNTEYHTLSAVAIYSMLVTPFLISIVAHSTLKINNRMQVSEHLKPVSVPAKVIIVGYGLAGKHLSQVLRSATIPYVIIECNGKIARDAFLKEEAVIFGDATRRDILEHSGIRSAQAVVILISDHSALKACIGIARLLNPNILIVCRTRRMSDIEPLLKAGANEVISEEFETSIELFTVLLTRLHIPRNIIRAQTHLLRQDGYEMLRVPTPIKGVSDKLAAVLAAGTTDVFQVMQGHFADGRSLRDLAIRNKTGVTVIAIVREDTSTTNPPPEIVLQKGDAVVVMGSHAQIEATFNYLEGKEL